jgi:C4-type Zn-finger protein
MSFKCDHCGHRDSEVNSAGEIQGTSSASMGNWKLTSQQRESTTLSTSSHVKISIDNWSNPTPPPSLSPTINSPSHLAEVN